jgi:5-hydroxyisourate hydrolase
MGYLTTHVLDTSSGLPAAGMPFTLSRLNGERQTLLLSGTTNIDGRFDRPLLEDEALMPGLYELAFSCAEYFRARGTELPDPPFLDRICLCFGVADPTSHYHVPLIVSPWSYSTYRGS